MIDGDLAGLFTGLFDDASMFPPQDEPPSSAVADHLAHRMAWYADMVGPFVCSAGRLSTINDLAARHGVERLAVAVVVPGGLQALPTTIYIGPTGKVVYVHTGEYQAQGSLNADLNTYAVSR